MNQTLLELINDCIEQARVARRKAAGDGKPEIAAVHSEYINKLTALKEVHK